MAGERALINQIKKSTPQIAQNATGDFIIPNHSGDHSAGNVLKTPSNNTDIVNKAYVDSAIAAIDLSPYWTDSSTSTGTNKTLNDATTNDIHANTVHGRVFNNTGSVLNKGVAVYVSGYNSGQDAFEVDKADNNDTAAMPCIGIIEDTIPTGEVGEMIITGVLTGINTSSFNNGDELYIDSSPGNLTNTKPTATTSAVQKVAVVLKKAASGSIMIFGAGRSNDIPNSADRNFDMGLNDIDNVGSLTVADNIIHDGDPNTQIALTEDKFTFVAGGISRFIVDTGGVEVQNGTLDMNSQKIVELDTPTASTDAANKAYVDGLHTIDFQHFSSSGTWTKPSNARAVHVICIGAGGGGGSGKRRATGLARAGGAGGGAGYATQQWFNADSLGASETVTVGTGGTGGAAITADNTNGNAGTAGGDSYFGGTTVDNSILKAQGGAAGAGGTNAASPGSAATFTAQSQVYPAVSAGTQTVAGRDGAIGAWGPTAGGGR